MDAASALYGPHADIKAILTGSVPAPPDARAFLEQVRTVFPSGRPIANL